MKARYLIGCIALAVLVLFAILLAKESTPRLEVKGAQELVQRSKTNAAEVSVVEKPQQLQLTNAYETNGPLSAAYEMAIFIDQVHDSVLRRQAAARDHLKGLQAGKGHFQNITKRTHFQISAFAFCINGLCQHFAL